MTDDFTAAELSAISAFRRAAKTLPEDFYAVPAVQELACLYAKIEPLLTTRQKATIVGCGALLAHHAEKEMTAGIYGQCGIAESEAEVSEAPS